MLDYASLKTEQTNDRSKMLDQMNSTEIVTLMNDLDAEVSAAVRKETASIAKTAQEAADRMLKGGRLFYLGAGTSGRLGVLDASECPPTFGVSPDLVIGIIAGGDGALRTAVEGAEDSLELAKADLIQRGLNDKDIVVAISASGTANYCIGALKYAREAGALPVSLCCNKNTVLSGYADIAIEIETGAEVLSGSTRLRAGTATKMALNMISTTAMVLMGKAYRNLMVDVSASNVKLRDRAVRITMKACGIDRKAAEELLTTANGSLKTAIVMHEAKVDRAKAEAALESMNGYVRKAIRFAGEN